MFVTNNMHREDKAQVIICIKMYTSYILYLYYKFIWCILANIKTLTGSVISHLNKTIVFFLDRQPANPLTCLSCCLSPENIIFIQNISFCPSLLLLLSQVLAKTGNPRSNHTCTNRGHRKECYVIHGWPSLKGCDTIRRRQKPKTPPHNAFLRIRNDIQVFWGFFFFTSSAICTFLCV